MRRSFGAALVAAALITGISAIVPASTQAAYYGPCNGSNGNLHGYLDDSFGSSHIDYATGSINYLRDVHTCTTSGTKSAYILPVNIQGNAFVQLGYGRFNENDALDWVYTYSDSNGGVLIHPSFSHTKPVLTHQYKLVVYLSTLGSWRFQIQDLTASTTQDWPADTTNHTWGNEAWWGFETFDYNDQYGGPGSTIFLNNLGWQFVGTNTTSWQTRTSIFHIGTKLSYQHDNSATDQNGRAYISAYTSSH